MVEKVISDLFRIKARFLRSAHLERDFYDPTALSDYVVTDFIESCMARLAHGLKPRSGQRAWRVTGDYGSGKSSFALVLAQWFAGNEGSFTASIRRVVNSHKFGVPRPNLLPVLVTCSRTPLAKSILRSLHQVLTNVYGRSNSKLAGEIRLAIEGQKELSDDHAFELIIRAKSRVKNVHAKGMLLVLDELGKFLEFAALHPHHQDVFLLQRLAEEASRSGEEPLFVICLLHQGFNAYADQLSQPSQREWEKVAGRFEEIIFSSPVEQIAQLVTAALNVNVDTVPKAKVRELKKSIAEVRGLGWFGSASLKCLLESASQLYPLHPAVLPVLVRAFRRFGQNERSLFSFLLSNEPFGLQAFSRRSFQDSELYRLHHFYDYVRANFGHRLSVLSYRSHWNLIESTIESFVTESEFGLQILKTVGILNLLNDSDLLPTEESLVCLLEQPGRTAQNIHDVLHELKKGRRVLYDRGRARGLCLWPHTSVDLEKAYDDACRSVDVPLRLGGFIKDYLEMHPLVARRHYIETGNLRHFDVRYCSLTELPSLVKQGDRDADGVLIVPLCETLLERTAALEFAQRPEMKERLDLLVAVPQPLSNLAGPVQEVRRWEWVSMNVLELNGDKYAREEVSRQKAAVQSDLERRMQSIIGWKQPSSQMAIDWFYRGRHLRIDNGRQLLSKLSSIFDQVYELAPHIHNELINRRSLSSAAAAARMRLIERMFTDGSKPLLGMDERKKPPEMSMYLSVFKVPGLHRQDGQSWRIREPNHRADPSNVLPALRRIRELVRDRADDRVNVAGLFEELRKSPYGVRDGVLPLLLSVFAIEHEKDIAFYKDGSFLRELNGEAMLVLTKSPERFEIQYCKIEGIRAEVFEKLLEVLEVRPANHGDVVLLDVVKKLCVFVAQLPAYVLNTKRLSPRALAVRNAILNAREPARLLFTDLPLVCGFEAIGVKGASKKFFQDFVMTLKAALDELKLAYPDLQERLKRQAREIFELSGSFQEARAALAARAQQLLVVLTDAKLRAFCLRLMDGDLPESQWLESLGSYLALKPPSKWHDTEEEFFNSELFQMAARFRRVESVFFARSKTRNGTISVRLSITQAGGEEQDRVVHYTAGEENQVREMQAQVSAILARDNRLGLVAASRAIWSSLEKGVKTK